MIVVFHTRGIFNKYFIIFFAREKNQFHLQTIHFETEQQHLTTNRIEFHQSDDSWQHQHLIKYTLECY